MNSPTRSLFAYDDSDPENKPVHPLIPIGRTVFLGTPEDGKTCTLMNLLFRPDIVKHLRRFYKGGCIIISAQCGPMSQNFYWKALYTLNKTLYNGFFTFYTSMNKNKWMDLIVETPCDGMRLIILDDMANDAALMRFVNARIVNMRHPEHEHAHLWMTAQKSTGMIKTNSGYTAVT